MKKKILVAVDGSIYSSNSLDYLIHLFADDPDMETHLLAVVSAGSGDQNWMFDVDPLRAHSPAEERRIATASRYLREARSRLLRQGFSEEQVSVSTHSSSLPIAKTLLMEAEKGNYDALLIGRRGVGMVGEMFFGSVSASLLETCHSIPLWIIDGEVQSTRFLLAVHSTPESLLAADHLAFITASSPGREICLYHSTPLFGSTPAAGMEHFHKRWGKEWCDNHLDPDNHLFGAHTALLLQGGVTPERISSLEVQTDFDASRDLLRQAKKHGCGTIVLGRRGMGIQKGLLGGVSDRTTKNAENLAVWLVG